MNNATDNRLDKTYELTAKAITRINREKYLINKFLELGAQLNEDICFITPYIPPKLRRRFIVHLENYSQYLGEFSEVLTLYGKDVEELGKHINDTFTELIEELKEEKPI